LNYELLKYEKMKGGGGKKQTGKQN